MGTYIKYILYFPISFTKVFCAKIWASLKKSIVRHCIEMNATEPDYDERLLRNTGRVPDASWI
jgi:hypothetical protein